MFANEFARAESDLQITFSYLCILVVERAVFIKIQSQFVGADVRCAFVEFVVIPAPHPRQY